MRLLPGLFGLLPAFCPRPRARLRPLPCTQHRRHRACVAAAGCVDTEVLEVRQLLAADMVLQWNDVLLQAIRNDRTAPPLAARQMAIMHVAVYDAVNSIDRRHAPYLVQLDVHPRTSPEAAAAAAAASTLMALFPAQQAEFQTQLTEALASIPDGRAKTDGIQLGQTVASRVLAHRASDGSDALVTYVPGSAPGDWQPTPPGLATAVLPQWPGVQPWAMQAADQFRPAAPPDLTSAAYATDLLQVQQVGAADSAVRTQEQTEIARFWSNGAGTSTPPGHWNLAAQTAAEARQNSLQQNARLFALLNIALADAAISCWDAKYEYNLWRPVTAVRGADTDQNPATEADAGWTSLLVTPAFPTYTSGHSTFSAAAAAVLTSYFGTDQIAFDLASETPGAADRHFQSFSEAAAESGMSRVYGGIHFQFDNQAGLASGRQLGQYVARRVLQPVTAAPVARLINGELFVYGTARADSLTVQPSGRWLLVKSGQRTLGYFAQSQTRRIIVDAGAGDDFVSLARVGIASEIYGGAGHDVLHGGRGADRLFGEDGRDLLLGNAGNDWLDGGAGRDVLLGQGGRDTLVGVRGLDLLFGGSALDDLLWRNLF